MTDGRLLAGRYRLGRLLGLGGMAEVYAAHDQTLDRPVAVKLLLPRFRDDDAFVARFRREAQASASLNHPNIVGVFDTGEHDALPFIVMELVRGRSLQEAMRHGGLTEDRSLEVLAEVCAALDYAHASGLIHRDVKPGNIMLADDGSVKVTDFGIARAIDADTVTQTAAVLGTAAYLSPEQAQGHKVDARSDVYSLGVVLYEVLTGRQPFQGDSPVTVAYQHVQEMPRPPRDWNGAISSSAEAIAVRAMAKNPANRYASAEAMRTDLLRARVGESVAAPAVMTASETALLDSVPGSHGTPVRTEAAERRRKVVGYVLLGLLSLAAAAAAVIYVGSLFTADDAQRLVVPDVVNLDLDEAQTLLEGKGLRFRVVGQEYSDEIAVNLIATQVPAAGSRVSEGALIQLTQSRGRRQTAVPNVVGMPEEQAIATLRQAELRPVRGERVFDDQTEAGTVVDISPRAGTEVPAGSQVEYTVSEGAEQIRVRSVVGRPEADAIFELEDQELEVLVVREFSDAVDEGVVIRQDPGAGSTVEKGSEATIVVSKGRQAPPTPTPTPTPTPSPTPSPDPTEPSPPPSPDPSPTVPTPGG